MTLLKNHMPHPLFENRNQYGKENVDIGYDTRAGGLQIISKTNEGGSVSIPLGTPPAGTYMLAISIWPQDKTIQPKGQHCLAILEKGITDRILYPAGWGLTGNQTSTRLEQPFTLNGGEATLYLAGPMKAGHMSVFNKPLIITRNDWTKLKTLNLPNDFITTNLMPITGGGGKPKRPHHTHARARRRDWTVAA